MVQDDLLFSMTFSKLSTMLQGNLDLDIFLLNSYVLFLMLTNGILFAPIISYLCLLLFPCRCSFNLQPYEGSNAPVLTRGKLSAPRILRIHKVSFTLYYYFFLFSWIWLYMCACVGSAKF